MGKWFAKGKAQAGWYSETFESLTPIFGSETPVFIAMLAATSINATVKSNVKLALKAFKQWKAQEPFSGFLPVVVKQLQQIVDGRGLTGRKIKNFADAFTNPEAVVVDRWMLRAAGYNKPDNGANKTEYDRVERMVRRLAKKLDLPAREVQAGVWFGIKDQTERKRGTINPAPPFEVLVRELIGGLRWN